MEFEVVEEGPGPRLQDAVKPQGPVPVLLESHLLHEPGILSTATEARRINIHRVLGTHKHMVGPVNIPDDLHYTSHDEWVRKEGDVYTIGITDFAQDQLGELVHFEPPEVGATVAAEDVVCEVESVKAVAEIYAPLSGTIVEVNTALADGPEAINSDPYGNWIYKIEATGVDLSSLMTAEAYKAKIA